MSGLDPKDNTAMCPQCRTEMVHVAVTPHPVVRHMQRNTFVCYTCKRTRTYMLPGTFTPETRDGAATHRAS
jgi:transposase-like protein